jgi:hypothetical protein
MKFKSISYFRTNGKIVVTMQLLDTPGHVRTVQLTRKDLGIILKTIVAVFGIAIGSNR